MPELTGSAIGPLGVALMVFVAGLTSGATGLGFAQIMAAGLALMVDPKTAVAILSIMVPVTSSQQVFRHRAQAAHFRRVAPLYLAGLAGVPVGVLLLSVLPSSTIALLLGIFTLVFVATGIRKIPISVRPGQERYLGPLVGLTGGIANGTVGVSGPVLASYLLAAGVTAGLFTFTVSMMFLSMSTLRFFSLLAVGELTGEIVLSGVVLLVPALLGQRVGFWLQDRISKEYFQRAVMVMLFLAGVGLLVRGVGALSG